MTPADRLAGLAGRWRTLRVLRHGDGTRARFLGVSTWAPDGTVLRCTEAGTLEQAGRRYEAHRVTLWRATVQGVEVLFADGRPFHRLPVPGDRAVVRHDCAPDVYDIAYDFRARTRWTLRWRVRGPRKDYRALTRYLRISP
ncbi:DUF6314 family protein [Jannaschia rubra]|uniref:DUF6314 domain-containing protein n=1 Tax=Jannaschia rubra TaxID=282197 RepID=A0A0M6XP80_9RHOB|nr:DUF6314 family protein [Jannaschia rubra]CTQ32407.1 hypothetical protein JAN5088_01172 [Jannaschia rubra]SFG45051.1 hypothetical protein SAMN04488517_10532 [Jannaschia rubra]